MTAPDRVAAVLLAAGSSQRFGPSNKLLAALDGRPMLSHVVNMLARFDFAARIAVAGEAVVPLLGGFDIVMNDDPARGLSHSLRIGAARALAHDVDAVLIVLGDMPFVDADHIRRLLTADGEIRASAADGVAMPPALFSRARTAGLATLTGDRGAHALLAGAVLVPADPETLRDIDTEADLPR